MSSETPSPNPDNPPLGAAGFPARLEKHRRSLGLSVLAFARLCHVPNSAMRDYLAGRAMPGMENLVAIVRALRVSMDSLVLGPGAGSKPIDSDLLEAVILEVFTRPFGNLVKEEARGDFASSVALLVSLLYEDMIPLPTHQDRLRELRKRLEVISRMADASIAAARAK